VARGRRSDHGGSQGLRRRAAFLISFGLGVYLLVAAVTKAADPGMFIEQIRGYRIFPSLAVAGAYCFLMVEFLLALLLLFHVLPRPALAGFVTLMLLFVGVTAWAWAHGNASGCGCFGRLADRGPGAVILEDLIAVALALVGFFLSPWIIPSRGRWIAGAVVLPVLLALPWVLPALPIDSWVTPLRPGTSLEDLAAEDMKVPLSDGRVFVAFLGDGCASCVDALPVMEEVGAAEGGPRVTGIFAGNRAEKRAWALEHVPSFPLAHAPVRSLRQYYRKLPVFVLLDQGKVERIWWNRIPPASEVLAARR
jgi:thiol-disulfide isomerase/thioredoxin